MKNKVAAIIVAGGKGKRMNVDKNKVFIHIEGKPIFYHSLKAFIDSEKIGQFVLVCRPEEEDIVREIIDELGIDATIAHGGKERQDSVYNGLLALNDNIEYVMVHDSARPFINVNTIEKCFESLRTYGSGVVGVYSIDTIKQVDGENLHKTLNRDNLVNIQTPQCFRKEILLKAHKTAQDEGFIGTDESILVERINEEARLVVGDYQNIKITTRSDLPVEEKKMKIGHGTDVHAFGKNRKLILGGVNIPHTKGLLGHSDADVLIHSIMDSLLGAAGLSDIGNIFPDNDNSFKNISSILLLERVNSLLKEKGYKISNIDSTLIMQTPKVAKYIPQMREKLSDCLDINKDRINIKATTTEYLGFVGRCEGVQATSVCIITN